MKLILAPALKTRHIKRPGSLDSYKFLYRRAIAISESSFQFDSQLICKKAVSNTEAQYIKRIQYVPKDSVD